MASRVVSVSTIFLVFSAITSTLSLKTVIKLDEDNWRQMLEGKWMVEFFAPWCPACKGLEPLWKEYATWSDDLDINVAQVDVTTSPGLSGRFLVTALPTIFHVINGEFRQYKGPRDKNSLISFIEENKWKSIDPVPLWKSPSSIPMSICSTFFRLSQNLRHVHNQLMEEFGLPTWGSYLIFAIGTIVLGAFLGLILVCCIDFIYPHKSNIVKSKSESNEEEQKVPDGSGDELADEDIKDDLLDDAEKETEEEERSDLEGGDSKTSSPSGSPTGSPQIRKRKARKE